MKPSIIQFLLAEKEETQQSIAKRVGCSRTAVSQTIRGLCKSKDIELEVAKTLGLCVHEVFPERYDESGAPAPRKRKHKPSTKDSLAALASAVARMQAAQVAA